MDSKALGSAIDTPLYWYISCRPAGQHEGSPAARIVLNSLFLSLWGCWVGDHFKVDIDQLDRFVKTLQQATKDLDEARKALSHVRSAEIGTARLDEACDTFQERWKYGSEQLSEMIGGISEGVKANKLSYEEFEENLEKTLKQMAESATSGGGGKN